MSKIFAQQGVKVKLDSLELEEMFESVIDANDIILERVVIKHSFSYSKFVFGNTNLKKKEYFFY